MLEKITVGEKTLSSYRPVVLVEDQVIDEIVSLGAELRGTRLCHINATAYGGGVAELLYSCIPLLGDAGLTADWRVISGDEPFFKVTKDFHNALQGAEHRLSAEDKEIYIKYNIENAEHFDSNYDVIIVNDPQPAALRHFCNGNQTRWIWRCHIDTSNPNQDVWQFLKPYIEEYDCAIFTLEQYVPTALRHPWVEIIAPAIDPNSPKNRELPVRQCIDFLPDMGIDANRPLAVQVSRFDPWKDPFGVIEAYRLAKKEMPGLQLALVGSLASDDPQGIGMLEQVESLAENDPDLFVFYNLSDIEINVFQRVSNIVIQKSLREGFGLTVSEALWKATPVVGGWVGGIPLQLGGGLDQLLVGSVEECAEKMVMLLQNRDLAGELADKGKERVQRDFLVTRLVRDELRLAKKVMLGQGRD
ncbi:MAG: glycosyltransferase [Desulfobacteraceae bacterium]|nr:glycosyltransferase [Desulfobacteraceae bacterium]